MGLLDVIFISTLILGSQSGVKSECPLGCYCRDKVVECTSLMDFPHDLARDTEKIHVSHMNIEEIPKMAFSYLHNISVIQFEQSNIGRLASCSFMNMHSIKKIIFNKVVIGSVESFAFNSLKNLERIEFLKSRIGRLKSFAFYQVSYISYLVMVDSNIEFVYKNAFTEVYNVSTLRLTNNNVSDVVTSVFRDVRANNIEIKTNTFWNLHCGVLEDMSRSSTENFIFSFNSFYCNCSISNLIDKFGRENYNSILSQNTCHGPKSLVGVSSLAALDLDNLKCKEPKTDEPSKCQPIEENIVNPTCTGIPTEMGKAGLQDKNPEGLASGLSRDLSVLQVCVLLSVLIKLFNV